MEFNNKYQCYLDYINEALERFLQVRETPEKACYEAMKYSLMAGGKRIRPVLSLAVCDLLGKNYEDVIAYACAIEMIHTYSLIHDDLPSMDNDDYRRGRLTNHKVYGEALAILAGDALLNYAFEIMTEDALKNIDIIVNKVKAMQYIAKASGVTGMIGGQVVDLQSEGKKIPLETLTYMHGCKTGAMIKAPVVSSAIICGADDFRISRLSVFAEKIGLAFQIKDDILDVEGDLSTLGKNSGSDASNDKTTYITEYGLEDAKRILNEVTDEAVGALECFGVEADFLRNIAEFIAKRNN
ncbi:MAG TPA: polyprenyl synthetase family protein [Pseudobacteroides sp.]|nr:polyprenyl synthetase family protein [Pseudobacteroides sp.]